MKKYLIILVSVLFLFGCSNKIEKQTETENPKEDIKIEEKQEPKKISVLAVGDTLIHGTIYNSSKTGKNTYDFSPIFEEFEPIVKKYDLAYYNQETIIGGKDLGLSGYPRFNSPDEIGDAMTNIGFNLVNLANNHSLDMNEKGVLHSVDYWKSKKNVVTAGSYSSWDERNDIKVYTKNGIKYAFLAYTTTTNGLKTPEGKEYLVNTYSDKKAKEDIEKVKDKVDVIIVSMHWGVEYTHTPNSDQKRIASYLSSLGVNVIIGSHPHVIEPIDYIDDTLVIYSLGNFVSAQIGIERLIGLMVSFDIIVDNGNVKVENMNYDLTYTYYAKGYTNFKVYPFSKLNDKILPDHKNIETKFRNIVDKKVVYD